MKQSDVRRDIKRASARQLGDSHDLGKLTRVRGGERPPQSWERGSGRRSKESFDDQPKAHSKVSTFIIASVGSVIIAVGLGFWVFLQTGDTATKDTTVSAVQNVASAVVSHSPPPSEKEALAFVERVLSIRDPAKLKEDVRLGTSTVDEVISFLAEMSQKDGKIIRYDWLSSMDQGETPLEGVSVTYESDHLTTRRIALLTPDDRGAWQLDFESFARRVTPTWEEILKGGFGKATVRVLVARDSYYNGHFDEGEWSCYGIGSPDVDEVIYGYCKIDSTLDKKLRGLLSDGVRSSRVTLEIQSLPEGGRRQFEITKVLAIDWALPSEPLVLTE